MVYQMVIPIHIYLDRENMNFKPFYIPAIYGSI